MLRLEKDSESNVEVRSQRRQFVGVVAMVEHTITFFKETVDHIDHVLSFALDFRSSKCSVDNETASAADDCVLREQMEGNRARVRLFAPASLGSVASCSINAMAGVYALSLTILVVL